MNNNHVSKKKELYQMKSPCSNKHYEVLFEENKYVSQQEDLWKIISIINDEDVFEKTLPDFESTISEQFIEELFKKFSFIFYSNSVSKKIYTNSPSGFYEQISLYELLNYLDINGIDELIEKGSKQY